jgi:nicotinamidase-related amidase
MTRIWDRFLTERDHEHLQRFPARELGLGQRPLVLMIDNYRQALGDEPQPLMDAVETWPSSTGLEGWAAVESGAILLAGARKHAVPVIHLTGLDEDEADVRGWWERGTTRGEIRRSPEEEDRHDRRFDIVEPVAPVPGEGVLRKAAPSAFWGTPLMATLIDKGIDTLIVAGESTSGCVRATVVDAASSRFRVGVVEECTYDRMEASHALALFDMDRKYADVISLAHALRYFESLGHAEPSE